MIRLFISRHVHDVIRNAAIDDTAVRRLDEAVLINAGIACQIVDQTDVRTFRCLNRADTAIVRVMNITDFEACTLTRQTARTKCRDTALVRQHGQRIFLIHELGQLRRREEFLHRCLQRIGIGQLLRCHAGRIRNGHLFLDVALHAGKTDTELVLQQFANRTNTTVAQHINIINGTDAVQHCQLIVIERIHIAHCDRVLVAQRIGADHLDRSIVVIEDRHFLNTGANKPDRNLSAIHDGIDDRTLIIRGQRHDRLINDVTANQNRTVFTGDIFAADGCTADYIETAAVVENSADIVIGNFDAVCVYAGPYLDAVCFLGKQLGIFRRNDRPLLPGVLLAFHIFGKNTADQSLRPGRLHLGNRRMRKFMLERQCAAGNALVELITEQRTICLGDLAVLLEDNTAVGTGQIRLQTVSDQTIKNTELLVDLVAADLEHVIAAIVKELLIHRRNGAIDRRNVICTLVLINRQQSITRRSSLISCQRVTDLFVVSEDAGIQQHIIIQIFTLLVVNDNIRIQFKTQSLKELLNLCRIKCIVAGNLIKRHTNGLEKNRRKDLPAPVDGNVDQAAEGSLLFIGHELQPRAAARNQFACVGICTRVLLILNREVGTRRTDDLRNDNPFCTIDDESSARRHHREVAEEDFIVFLNDFAGLLIDDLEFHIRLERCTVVHFTILALSNVVLRLTELVIQKFQLDIAGIVRNRENIVKNLLNSLFHEPLE